MKKIMNNDFFIKSLYDVKKIVLESLEKNDVQIILFGSVARGDVHQHSDIDIGFLPRGEFDKRDVILLKEKLENMNIPYSVDLVDLSKVSEVFFKNIMDEGEIWRN